MKAFAVAFVVLVWLLPASSVVRAVNPTGGSESQFLIVTTTESAPNAVPPAAGAGIYGNTNDPSNCSVASDDSSANCYDPLYFTFDAITVSMPIDGTTLPVTLANLPATGMSGNNNLLENTNSLGSSDGGVTTLSASFGCPASGMIGQISVTEEDGSTWTFTVDPSNSCSPTLSFPITGTFTSSGGMSGNDTGTFSMYVYPNANFAGMYTGTFDGSTNPGTGATTSNIDFSIDPTTFAVTGTLGLTGESLGACQPSSDTFSTALAISQLPTDALVSTNVAGFTTGGMLFMIVTDAAGNQEWATGSVTDANNILLPSNQLFWTAYGESGECLGIYSWDKIFTKKSTMFRRAPRPQPRRIVRLRRSLPQNWQRQGAFDPRDWRFQQLNRPQPEGNQSDSGPGEPPTGFFGQSREGAQPAGFFTLGH
jgi:hypothetical protein